MVMTTMPCVFCKSQSSRQTKFPDGQPGVSPGNIWQMQCGACGYYEITFQAIGDFNMYSKSHSIDLNKIRDWIKTNPGVLITTQNITALF